MDRGERRNKGKEKGKEKKKHPYKVGGRFRTGNVSIGKPSKSEIKNN